MSRRGGSFSTNRQPCPRGRLLTWLLTTKVMTSPTRNVAPCTKRSPRLGNRLRRVVFGQRRRFWTNFASGGEPHAIWHSIHRRRVPDDARPVRHRTRYDAPESPAESPRG